MAYGSLLADVVQSSTAGTPPQFNDGNGTQTGTLCRAWANFNGTLTGTNAPRASFNVSSITRTGTGAYTVNFTNALPDTNYAYCGTAWNAGSSVAYTGLATPTTTSAAIQVNNGTPYDAPQISAAFFR